MANLKELREQQEKLHAEARDALNEAISCEDEGRAQELEARHDAIMADFDKVQARAEKLAALEAQQRKLEEVAVKTPVREAIARGVDKGLTMDYRRAFAEMVAAGGDSYVDPEVRNVLREYRAQTTTAASGGYTVPSEVASFVEKSLIASGPMLGGQYFSYINSPDGRTFTIPTVDDTAVTAVAHTEGAAVTDDGGKDATFAAKTLGAYSFDTEWVRISKELDADSIIGMEGFIGQLLGERLGRLGNAKLTTGSGSSDVEGIVTNTAAGKVAASTSAITSDEIIDFVHSVDAAYRASASTAIMMDDTTLAAVRKLKDGQGNYLWSMGNVQGGVPATLLGYNVLVNNDMAGIGDGASSKVMVFGDMSKYYVRRVGGIETFAARERFAPDYGLLGFMRVDGVLSNTAAIKHLALAAS